MQVLHVILAANIVIKCLSCLFLRHVKLLEQRLCHQVNGVQETPCMICLSREGGKSLYKIVHHHGVVHGIIAGNTEHLWTIGKSPFSIWLKNYLFCYPKLFQDLLKCIRELFTSVRLHLNQQASCVHGKYFKPLAPQLYLMENLAVYHCAPSAPKSNIRPVVCCHPAVCGEV